MDWDRVNRENRTARNVAAREPTQGDPLTFDGHYLDKEREPFNRADLNRRIPKKKLPRRVRSLQSQFSAEQMANSPRRTAAAMKRQLRAAAKRKQLRAAAKKKHS
jgi:tRNA U34 2-thiouridine synthase MnmA/TrmU